MRKYILFLSSIMLIASISIQCMERPAVYTMIDSLVQKAQEPDWPAIFAILDEMSGVIGVNEYCAPNGLGSLLTLATYGSGPVSSQDLLVVAKKLLVEYKANPNFICKQQTCVYTPLAWAIQMEDIPMIRLLLHYGADPYLKGLDGHDSIELAEAMENDDINKILDQYRK